MDDYELMCPWGNFLLCSKQLEMSWLLPRSMKVYSWLYILILSNSRKNITKQATGVALVVTVHSADYILFGFHCFRERKTTVCGISVGNKQLFICQIGLICLHKLFLQGVVPLFLSSANQISSPYCTSYSPIPILHSTYSSFLPYLSSSSQPPYTLKTHYFYFFKVINIYIWYCTIHLPQLNSYFMNFGACM